MRFLIFFFILFHTLANSKSINLSSEIDTSMANIGDIITWKIIAKNSNQRNVIFPDIIVEGDSISIRSQRSILTNDGEVGKIIEMTFWDTGRFHTPQYQISVLNDQGDFKYDIETEKLSLNIVSIITPLMDKAVRPLKKPVPVKEILPYREILLIILIIIIFTAIIWVSQKRLKNNYQKSISTYNNTPIDIARKRLSDLNEKGFAKEFYTELSHITREFVEYTTYIRTLEMTTQDIIQNEQLFLFDSNAFNSWINLLLKADMVKYAKQSVESSEMIVDKNKVMQFIDDLSD